MEYLLHMKNVLTLIFLFLLSITVHALTPEQVYKKVSNSVVFISDLDSLGSGVVLTSSGYIITNFHVVASGMPFEVKAMVSSRGKTVEKIFSNVKVEKVHKVYDLALIKLKLGNERLIPARKISNSKAISPGSRCFAIGNPEGLEKTISDGLVSGKRTYEKLDYLQISAAINPGNSGGAIANDNGELIGIATWKLDGSDNIGFAVPIQGIKMDDFGPLDTRKGDRKLGQEIEKEANRVYDILIKNFSILSDKEKDLYFSYVIQLHKQVLFHIPSSSSPYHNLALAYRGIKDYNTALSYIKRAVEINPKSAHSLHVEASIYLNKGDKVMAIKSWHRCLQGEGDEYVGYAAHYLAKHYSDKGEAVKSAYLCKWADAKNSDFDAKLERNKIWVIGKKKLNAAQLHDISRIDKEYSVEDIIKFLKLTGPAPEVPDSDKLLVPDGGGKKLFEKYLKRNKTVPEGENIIYLPSKPSSKILTSLGGTYLFMHFEQLSKIGVYNVALMRFERFIDFDHKERDFLWATGGDSLLIYIKKTKELQIYDLNKWEIRHRKIYQGKNEIKHLFMSDFDDKKAILFATFNGDISKALLLLDVKSGAVLPADIKLRGISENDIRTGLIHGAHGHFSGYNFSENGTQLILPNPVVTLRFRIRNSSIIISKIELENIGYVDVKSSFSGSYFLNDKMFGKDDLIREYSSKLGKRGSLSKVSPLKGRDAVVGYNKESKKMVILGLPKLQIIAEIPVNKPPSLSSLGLIFASSHHKKAGFVEPGNSRMSIFSYSGDDSNEKILSPERGVIYRQKVELEAGFEVNLDSAPDGVTFDKKTSEIVWAVPDDQESNKVVKILLTVKDLKGKEDYKIVEIYVP